MKKIIFCVAIISIATGAFAQVLSPKEFLGYELGEKFTRHHQVVSYFQHIAGESPNVKLHQYGTTNEDRPLLMALISSPENLANLEMIRTDNLKRAGVLPGSPSTDIAVVWLSYNVHGNESNSTEASMATTYKLLSEHQDFLENTLVVIDPCINPDGRERYVNFYWETGQFPFNPDPQSAEHQEPWPGGRQNHYLFDLNRDWVWQTQKESQLRLAEYNRWLPHIHVDFHEQGYNNPYYFAPAAQPYHEQITQWQRDFQVAIGKNHAKYFDQNDWLYFTKQSFDLLYPSYGDTYPMYNGAIGMTYEQGGSGRAGLGIIKQEGDTLTLLDRLTRHTTTGLSTIEIASEQSKEILRQFALFFQPKKSVDYQSFVLKSANVDKMDDLKQWLDKNQIQYGTSTAVKGMEGYNFQTKNTEAFSLSDNDLVVSVNQPKGVLIKVLFEPTTRLVDSLTYDITAWSVPYFYGIQAYATRTALIVKTIPYKDSFSEAPVPEDAYAFFFKWNSMHDAQLLSSLLNKQIKVRFTDTPILINATQFERGTFIVSERDNKHLGGEFERQITQITNTHKAKFEVVKTGFMDGGPDLGSRNIHYLKAPKIAILRGEGVTTTDYGATWFFMEQELGYPFSALNTTSIEAVNLDEYNVLIMQDGRYRNLSKSAIEKIITWVKKGGKLIAIDESLKKLVNTEFSSLKNFTDDEDKKDWEQRQAERAVGSQLIPYSEQSRNYASRNISGAIFRVTLDNTHPLAYGYGKEFYSLKTGASRYGFLNNQNVGIIKSANDHINGFAGQFVKEDIVNSMALGVENIGGGRIVYFVDNPLFRDFWYDAKLLFVNALFFVGN